MKAIWCWLKCISDVIILIFPIYLFMLVLYNIIIDNKSQAIFYMIFYIFIEISKIRSITDKD
jgi:hypothetical protein